MQEIKRKRKIFTICLKSSFFKPVALISLEKFTKGEAIITFVELLTIHCKNLMNTVKGLIMN